MEQHEPMFKLGDSYSYTWDRMHTSEGNKVDSKQDMVSIMMSFLSQIGADFVRDDREHPI